MGDDKGKGDLKGLHRIGGPDDAKRLIGALSSHEWNLVADVVLKKLSESLFSPELSQVSAMKRLKSMAIKINSVIDVGASNGIWSVKAEQVWPDAHYLLVEGYSHWKEKLEERISTRPKWKYIIAAAGAEIGTVFFHQDPNHPGGGHAFGESKNEKYTEVPCITLDKAVQDFNMPKPYFVKLDTHGFEKEIFSGAKDVLKDTNLIQVEVYNFSNRGRLRFHEMCAYLEERGFRCADLADVIHRPGDQILWQMDMFFIRADRKEFEQQSYR